MITSRKPRLAVRIVGWFVIILLPLMAVEMTAFVIYLLKDGRLISVKTRLAQTSNTFVDQLNSRTGCRYIDTLYPHPYLAHVYKYEPDNPCSVWSNSVGLLGREFPFHRDAGQFTILLAGGSVAGQLGQLQRGGPFFLEEELNRCFKPPHGERFVVLNGGGGAWKQPIMAILYLVYGEVFDGVVTLEGFNEHYSLPHSRLEIPSNNFIATNAFVSGYQKIAATWLANEMIRFSRENALLSRSYAAFAAIDAARRYLEALDEGGESRKKTFYSIFSLPAEWTTDKKFAFNLVQYRKYIRSIDALAKSRGSLSAFFIQPVPAIGKALTDDEIRHVGNLDYGTNYHRMTDGLLTLSNEGISIFSLLDVFDDQKGTLYADPIHLRFENGNESTGYRILATAMARRIAAAWRLRSVCENP